MKNKALLIIDIQNDYFDNGANPLIGNMEACTNAARVLQYFRGMNQLVIHVQHLSTRPGSTFFIPDTEGAKIHDHVKPLSEEKVIIKNYPNSFRDTELLNYLADNKIEELIVCGMTTHMCVDATVRAAKDYGFEITVIGDACATKNLSVNGKHVDAENVQTAFLSALNYFYATINTVEEYLAII